MLINQTEFDKYFINGIINKSVIHITLTNISQTQTDDITHLLSIRLKDMKNIPNFKRRLLASKTPDYIDLNKMAKDITFFVGMKDGKVDFSNIIKIRSENINSCTKLKFKNIKYILFLGKLHKDEEKYSAYGAVKFNISNVIYIYSENILNDNNCFEKVRAETDIFNKKILYCLYNIDYITFTGNYLNYILEELRKSGGDKNIDRRKPPNKLLSGGGVGGNNQIDVINNLEVNNNNKDFKEVHEEDVIIRDNKIIKRKGNKIQKKLTKTEKAPKKAPEKAPKKAPEKAPKKAPEKAPKKAPKKAPNKLLIDFS
jgi:hypothetical protein